MFDVLAPITGLRGDVPFEAWQVAWVIVAAVSVTFMSVVRRPPEIGRGGGAATSGAPEAAAPTDAWSPVAGLGRGVGLVGRGVGLVALASVLAAGAFGSTVDGATIAPTVVWVLAWAWLPIIAVLAGDPWPHLSPFDTLARLVGAPSRRAEPAPGWSHWLAPAAMAVFVATALTHPHANSAQLIAGLVGTYTVVAVAGAWWWGRAWLAEAETLAVYLRALGSLAPLQPDPVTGAPRFGRPLRAVAPRSTPAEAVLYLIVLGALLWDGVGASDSWRDFIGPAEGWTDAAWRLVGLVDVTAVVAVAALVAVTTVASVAGRSTRSTAASLAPVLLPLVAGAVVARLGQSAADGLPGLLRSMSDPFGRGDADLSGLATAVDETWLDADLVAWLQVGGVVAGAAAAVVVSNRCARTIVPGMHLDVVRAQYGVVFFVAVSSVTNAWFLLA